MPKVLGRNYNSDEYASFIEELLVQLEPDEELGDSSNSPYWALFNGELVDSLSEVAADEYDDEELTEKEIEFLEDHEAGGAIIYQGANGFLDIEFYDTPSSIRKAWAEAKKVFEEEEENGTYSSSSIKDMEDEEVAAYCDHNSTESNEYCEEDSSDDYDCGDDDDDDDDDSGDGDDDIDDDYTGYDDDDDDEDLEDVKPSIKSSKRAK